MTILQLLFPILALSCQSDPPPIDKNVVITVPKHVSSQDGDFEKMSFRCCDSAQGSQLLKNYLTLTTSMANDDADGTKKALTALQSFVQTTAFKEDSAVQPFVSAVLTWTEIDLNTLQQEFAEPSLAVVNYATKHSSSEGTEIVVAFCPMAPPPGRWLQTENTISNPFYGSQMLTCGRFVQ